MPGRRRAGLLRRAHQLDAAGLAAPAGMDLRLDHPDLAAEPARRRLRLGCGVGDAAAAAPATPYLASSSFAWYSWMFIGSTAAGRHLFDHLDQVRAPRRSDLSNAAFSLGVEGDLDDPLDPAGADHHRDADIEALDPVLA